MKWAAVCEKSCLLIKFVRPERFYQAPGSFQWNLKVKKRENNCKQSHSLLREIRQKQIKVRVKIIRVKTLSDIRRLPRLRLLRESLYKAEGLSREKDNRVHSWIHLALCDLWLSSSIVIPNSHRTRVLLCRAINSPTDPLTNPFCLLAELHFWLSALGNLSLCHTHILRGEEEENHRVWV